MREYARITGFAELPPLWSFGYMQSHRTLAGPDEIELGGAHLPREEAAVRRADLSRHRVHAVWMEHAQRRVRMEGGELSRSEEVHRRRTCAALQGRAAHRDRRPAHERRGGRSVHARQGGAERAHAGRPVARRSRGAVLLAVSQAALRPRRRRHVARPGRRPRRAVAHGAHSHVLGRPAAISAQRAAVRAASQRLARHAALRRVPVVGRRLFVLGDAEDARAGRDQHRPVRHSVLGHRHRRLRADRRLHRRAARALVPVRHLLPVVPLARPQLAPAPAVGLEHGQDSARRNCAATPAARPIPIRRN